MKKSTKITLLVAAAFCVTGLVLCFAAWSSVGFDFRGLSTADADSYVTQEAEFNTADLRSIKMEIEVDDVQVIPSRDDKIHLTYTDRDSLIYHVTNQGSTLMVEQSNKSARFPWFSFDLGLIQDNDCILELPEGFDGDLNIDNDVGDVTLDAITLSGTVDVEVGTGSVESTGLTAKSATVQTDVGDIVCSNWTIRQYLLLDTDTGDFTLRSSTVGGDLVGQTDVGAARLERVSAGTVDVSTETGDVTLNALASDRITFETDLGDVEGSIDGVQSEYTILLKTGLGDCEPDNQKGTTDKELKADSETGSISLQFIG